MKFVTYFENIDQLQYLVENKIEEAILTPYDLSRAGKTSIESTNKYAKALLQNKINPVLSWDLLMTQNSFSVACDLLQKIDLNLFSAIRLQDIGAATYILEKYKNLKIHLLLENGNHNIKSILGWCDVFGDRLEKIVLSIEIELETIKEYIKIISAKNIRVEILGLGRILLFYSPRSLLSPIFVPDKTLNNKYIEKDAASEESPHKGFPLIETKHGTLMYHPKEFCLFEYLDQLEKANLSDLLLDLRFGKNYEWLKKVTNLKNNFTMEEALKLKAEYPSETIKGYILVNKSDTLFSKLKNVKVKRMDENYLGEVIDSKKDSYVAFINKSNRDIEVGQTLNFINPEGKNIVIKISELKRSNLQSTDKISPNELGIISYIKKVVPKTQIYLNS